MVEKVDVAAFLTARRDRLIDEARASVDRAHLAHYEAAGSESVGERVGALTDLLISCCRHHSLDDATGYAASLATDRHAGGYPLLEVQTFINVLEEVVWRSVMDELPTDQQGYALGLVSTVLGAIKDSLARGYLAERGAHPVTLRVESLFAGSEGSPGHW